MSLCSEPDTSGINAAAKASAETADRALNWYMAKDAAAAPLRDEAQRKAIEVADQQLASSKANDALAADYANYNKTTFRPLEQGIVADAAAYDTPEKRQAAAESAIADVNSAFGRGNETAARRMAAEGLDGGALADAIAGQEVAKATSAAGAAYKARQGVETVGRAMKMDAASLGRNLPSAQATSAQVAISAGNNAVQNASVPVAQANQAAATYGQGFNTAIGGYQASGNLYGKAADLSQSDGVWGALGTVGGAAISKWSDETLKTDVEPTDPDQALQEVVSTPVSEWKYDPARMAARGLQIEPGDEGTNTGPMAQDANATMGDKAAPGGKKINLVTMNGKLMAAVQGLNNKVDRLAEMIGSGRIEAGAA